MAYKIMHRSRAQEVRFPTQAAAERYAEQQAGGLRNWTVVEAGQPQPAPEAQDRESR
ncbi:hypothetical protein [Amycolatopsis pithecellobii]|uniref:hypothetical protein n=1 Tax=Amycolatopsis pithecellobii TaxID=664692 RepID=UPI00140B257D|nr:hypothetical protein [Amycolatopsis pithecellobii]